MAHAQAVIWAIYSVEERLEWVCHSAFFTDMGSMMPHFGMAVRMATASKLTSSYARPAF